MIPSPRPLFLLALVAAIAAPLHAAEPRVGDAGSTPEPDKFDSNWPDMKEWANAGVRGGMGRNGQWGGNRQWKPAGLGSIVLGMSEFEEWREHLGEVKYPPEVEKALAAVSEVPADLEQQAEFFDKIQDSLSARLRDES